MRREERWRSVGVCKGKRTSERVSASVRKTDGMENGPEIHSLQVKSPSRRLNISVEARLPLHHRLRRRHRVSSSAQALASSPRTSLVSSRCHHRSRHRSTTDPSPPPARDDDIVSDASLILGLLSSCFIPRRVILRASPDGKVGLDARGPGDVVVQGEGRATLTRGRLLIRGLLLVVREGGGLGG